VLEFRVSECEPYVRPVCIQASWSERWVRVVFRWFECSTASKCCCCGFWA